jgi:bacterioferritin
MKLPQETGRQNGGTLPKISDVLAIRQRAREHLEDGAVTSSYPPDKDAIVALLNVALATELVCVLRYRRHHYVSRGVRAKTVAVEFLEHSNEEQVHADQLAERIVQLGGEPDFNPVHLAARSHAEYHEGTNLGDMIRADLIAERIAIDSYREMIAYVGDRDSTTRRLLEDILAMEERHADDLVDLLQDLPKE